MNIKKYIYRKYEGMGFAEVLIALMIVGIVGIVLMQMASNTLRELKQLDTEDKLSRYGVSTAVDLQRIAIEDMNREESSKEFAKIGGDTEHCFGINPQGTGFVSPPYDCPSINNNEGRDRNNYTRIYIDSDRDGSLEDGEQTEYFRVVHVKDINNKMAVVEIITGVADLKGLNTTNRDIKDYRYLAVIIR